MVVGIGWVGGESCWGCLWVLLGLAVRGAGVGFGARVAVVLRLEFVVLDGGGWC